MAGAALAAPALVLWAVFAAWPLAELLRLSLHRTDFITSAFVGAGNYLALLKDQAFIRAAANSTWYVLLLVPGQVGGALFISLLAWGLPERWRAFARVAFYLPVLSSGIIISQMWRWFFSHAGPANWIAGLLGIGPVAWMAEGATAIPAVALVLSVAAAGSYVVIILAAMEGVDRASVEAAMLDGASPWRIRRSIVLPAIAPAVLGCATLSAIAAPQVYETVNFLAPYDHAASMTWQIYSQAFRYSRHGLAAAMAVVLMAATAAMTAAKERIDA